MKKSVLKAYECMMAGLSKFGNHDVKNLAEMREVDLVDDKTGETVYFPADRVFYFFGFPICAVNTSTRTFRLSHAGVYATDKETGEVKEGEWPKTTTQTLMMYRDLCVGDGYTEIEPIAGRAAIDWRAHMEQYQKEKEMRKAGIPIPRKSRTKKAKINEAMLEMLEKEFGLSREAVLAKMAEQNTPEAPAMPSDMPTLPAVIPAEPVKLTVTNVDYIGGRPVWVLLDIMHNTLCVKGEHADLKWWEENLPPVKEKAQTKKTESSDLKEEGVTVIDADYIKKLQEEAKEKAKEKASKKQTKKTTKKTPAKKTTAKKTDKKTTAKAKKEAVA